MNIVNIVNIVNMEDKSQEKTILKVALGGPKLPDPKNLRVRNLAHANCVNRLRNGRELGSFRMISNSPALIARLNSCALSGML